MESDNANFEPSIQIEISLDFVYLWLTSIPPLVTKLYNDKETVDTQPSSEADGKCPDARLPKSRGMRRT
jgi:hypothetical protein